MKRLIKLVAIIATFTIAPLQAQTLDQLLDQVRTGSIQKTKVASDLEKQFKAAGAGKADMVASLKAQRAQLEARSDGLENQFAANDEELNSLRNLRERELGDLKELFGAVQQVTGESQAGFDTSIISAEYAGRSKKFDAISKKISQSNTLLTIDEIESVWAEVFNEMAQQGKVSTFNTSVATASGEKEERSVTRVGVFNLVSDGAFLSYGRGGVAELPRQPDGRFLGQAEDLQEAVTGESVEIFY